MNVNKTLKTQRKKEGLTWPSIPFDLFSCVSKGNTEKLEKYISEDYFLQSETQMKDENQSASLYYNTLILTFYEACKGGLEIETASQTYHFFVSEYPRAATPLERCRLLENMICTFTRKVRDSRKSANYSVLIRYCISYIFDHINESVKVSDLADECQISVATIRRYFKKEVKISPNHFITREKIRRAIFLMETTDLSITEISYQLGFCSQSYFTEQFRAVTGTTPAKFRKEEKYPLSSENSSINGQ